MPFIVIRMIFFNNVVMSFLYDFTTIEKDVIVPYTEGLMQAYITLLKMNKVKK